MISDNRITETYKRSVKLESIVLYLILFFLKMSAFHKHNGVEYINSTMVLVSHTTHRYMNKVLRGVIALGKETRGWCHGFKLHFICNNQTK